MRPEFFRDGIMGHEWLRERNLMPDPTNLSKTHVKLTEVEADGLGSVYWMMQGENWSPRGEAKKLIENLGLKHTSMACGDIAVSGGKAMMVDRIGFKELSLKETANG